MKAMHDAGLWGDLAITVLDLGFRSDQTYYYLGRAAEGLGYNSAAEVYYRLSILSTTAIGHKCDGLINNCDGFLFPRDAESQLTIVLEKRQKTIEQDKILALERQSRSSPVTDDPNVPVLQYLRTPVIAEPPLKREPPQNKQTKTSEPPEEGTKKDSVKTAIGASPITETTPRVLEKQTDVESFKIVPEALNSALGIEKKPQRSDARIYEQAKDSKQTLGQQPKVSKSPVRLEGFAVEIDALPPGFTGVNPKEVVSWFRKTISQIPIKIDEYSTPPDKERFSQMMAQRLEPVGVLPFVYDCYKSYDPSSQSFNFSFYPDTSVRLDTLKYFGLDSATLVVYEDSKQLGIYTGSNAFGVKRTVTRISRTEIALAYRKGSITGEPGDEPQSIVKSNYEFAVPLSSNEARQSDKDIRCLVLLRPTLPYLVDYKDYISPKIGSPREINTVGYALTGKFEQLWIFNRRTGKIYAKFQ